MQREELPTGHEFVSFGSFEALVSYLDDAEARSIEAALTRQWHITWGSHVIRVINGLAIFGKIFTADEFLMDGRKPNQMPDRELLIELAGLREAHRRGLRYGKWYSKVEPHGEYGSAHLASLWEITEQDFKQHEECGWELQPSLADRVNQEIKEEVEKRGTT